MVMLGSTTSSPPAKTGGLKYKARGTQYEIRDATVLTRAWLISGYQVGYRPTGAGARPLPIFNRLGRITPLSGPEETSIRSYTYRTAKVRRMIEVVAIVLGVFCVAIFVAHAVDAYLAPL
jgi:hypothetical protein